MGQGASSAAALADEAAADEAAAAAEAAAGAVAEAVAAEATTWRVAHELGRRRLGSHDAFHTFNTKQNGLLGAEELAAALAWLDVPVATDAEMQNLLQALDPDGKGAVSLARWAAAFPLLPQSEPGKKEQLSRLSLLPPPPPGTVGRRSLFTPTRLTRAADGGSSDAPPPPPAPQRLPLAAYSRVSLQLRQQRLLRPVWNDLGERWPWSSWAADPSPASPSAEGGDEGEEEQAAWARPCGPVQLSLGHFASASASAPRGTADVVGPCLLELSEAASLPAEATLPRVVALLLPPPQRYSLCCAFGAPSGAALYVWRAVPPTADFVALGMVATSAEEPPPAAAMRCVPRRWCARPAEPPKLVWRGQGQAGQPCSLWAGGMALLIATLGHELPEEERGWELTQLHAQLAASLGELERIQLDPVD